MKKPVQSLWIACVFVFTAAPFSLCSAAASEPSALGAQFVDLLVKEDFAGAFSKFDTNMRAALPEPKLRETWQTVLAQVGPLRKQLRTRVLKAGGYDVVLVTCEFAYATLDVKIAFNPKSEVSGLFFVPSSAAAESTGPPPYVRTNAFREKAFTIGTGEWSLPGTLTLPADEKSGPYTAVVLVHGSGPNDRDESVGAIKPFRDLAWGLATKGIAVVRYEKRTKEHAAKFLAGDIKITVREETIDDAVTAAEQLRHTAGIDPKRIFMLGHSLGGMVAPRIGSADPKLAGLIIMAGATRPLEDLIVEQTKYLLSRQGRNSPGSDEKLSEIESKVADIKKLPAADASSSTLLLGAPPAYWLDLRAHDPVAEAKTLKQPLLILQGGRDYQVTLTDFTNWKTGLTGSPNVTFKLYPKLNHLFVAGEGPSLPQEYEQPGHVEEEVVQDIANWISKTPMQPRANH